MNKKIEKNKQKKQSRKKKQQKTKQKKIKIFLWPSIPQWVIHVKKIVLLGRNFYFCIESLIKTKIFHLHPPQLKKKGRWADFLAKFGMTRFLSKHTATSFFSITGHSWGLPRCSLDRANFTLSLRKGLENRDKYFGCQRQLKCNDQNSRKKATTTTIADSFGFQICLVSPQPNMAERSLDIYLIENTLLCHR